jgi:hypothetical protein
MSVASGSGMRSTPPTAVHVARILENYSNVKQLRLDPGRHTVNIGFYRLPSPNILADMNGFYRVKTPPQSMLPFSRRFSVQVLPEFGRRLAEDAFEHAVKLSERLKPDIIRHFTDPAVRV